MCWFSPHALFRKKQFGHVLIEAMAMGIPVIGSTCGEIPNVMVGRTWCFQKDAARLAAILERMIREPAWREDRTLQHN